MSSILLFLLLTQAPSSQNYVGTLPNFSSPQDRAYAMGRLDIRIQAKKDSQQYPDLFAGACFTMRSYVFARQDVNAPVLVGTSTCTPASTLRMEQSRNHRGRLVFLNQPERQEQR
jgi:hypothetical protein